MSPLRDVPDELDTQRWLQGIDRSLLGVVEALEQVNAMLDRVEAKLDTIMRYIEDADQDGVEEKQT